MGVISRHRTSLSTADHLALPHDVRHELGLDDIDDVTVIVDGGALRIMPAPWTLEQIQGSAKTDPAFSEDFDEEIEQAIEEAILRKYQ